MIAKYMAKNSLRYADDRKGLILVIYLEFAEEFPHRESVDLDIYVFFHCLLLKLIENRLFILVV